MGLEDCLVGFGEGALGRLGGRSLAVSFSGALIILLDSALGSLGSDLSLLLRCPGWMAEGGKVSLSNPNCTASARSNHAGLPETSQERQCYMRSKRASNIG